jgi:hypothetical protein
MNIIKKKSIIKKEKIPYVLSHVKGSKKIIIFVHGLVSNKESKNYLFFEDLFNNLGISTIRFDLYGHGESIYKFKNLTISKAVNNLNEVLKFIKKKKFTNIGIFGTSFGGLISNIVVSKNPEIKLLVLKSPVSNYPEKEIQTKGINFINEWKNKGEQLFYVVNEKNYILKYNFYLDSLKLKNNGYYTAIKIKAKTFLIHGDEDNVVPVSQSIKLSKIIKNSEFRLLKGESHRIKLYKNENLVKEILDFVKTNL